MTMKHTPGPWHAWFSSPGEPIRVTNGGSNGRIVCYLPVRQSEGNQIENQANARLIAAAPDLLAELVKMRGRFYAALVSTGTDAEFASAAVADADLAIKRATEG